MESRCLCQSVELFLHGRCNFPFPPPPPPCLRIVSLGPASFLLLPSSSSPPPLPLPLLLLLLIFTYGAPYSKAPFHVQAPTIAASTCPSSTTTAIPLHRHYPRTAASLLQFQESCTLMTSAQPIILLLPPPLPSPPRQTPSPRHGSATGQSLSRG